MEANVSHVGGTTDVPKKIDSENETDNMENISYDEADTIDVSNVFEHPIDPSQEHMPEDYVNSSSRTQPSAKRGIFFKSEPKPDQTSMILIPHAYQTDKEAGDYFGATLYTYTWSSEQKFKYQHLLKDIKGGYPAQKMSICKGDELVFIGQTFTPNLDHTAVLNCFHHDVKVDGKTRFCLVLRKSEKKQWYETSAILSPNHREHRKL
ncbi:uncharacterized protein LOC127835714 [Dreissena polymorpha]|uniref:uncharacterized protein LOC127835714 n=1 Tax=Dreissena polymorpha TaxID=45954 RepID=UPI002263B026|nr:uncharacterized protein LOC127835714 [Dreissena polymorpha]